MVTAESWNTSAPSGALGYSSRRIGSASTVKPTAHGMMISMETVTDMEIFSAACL